MARKLKPVHPGEILREEFMKPLGLSMNKLALDLRVPVTRIAEIVHERRAISTDTALRLGRYFNTTPLFWMNLQVRYDLEVPEDALAQRITRDVQPRSCAQAVATKTRGPEE
jgi:addiction module HigA family antidote